MPPLAPRLFAAAAAALAAAGPAPAFYFKGWPGDGLPKPPTLIRSGAPTEANPPSASADPRTSLTPGVTDGGADQTPGRWVVSPPGGSEPTTSPGSSGPTSGETGSAVPPVPEPATLTLAGVGLLAAAVSAARSRRRPARP